MSQEILKNFKPSGQIIGLGSIIMDVSLRCEWFPQIGETVYTKDDYVMAPGGKGANQAVAAGRLGGKVKIIGNIADDDYGKTMRANLEFAGVDTSAINVIPEAHSGVAFVWVNTKGDNQIICSPAVNTTITVAELQSYEKLFQLGDIFMTTLEYSEEILYEAVHLAKSKGCLVVVDPSSNDYGKLTTRVTRCIDILKPNEVEVQNITGIQVTDRVTAQKAIDSLKAMGILFPILSLGEEGVVYEKENELVHQKGLKVNAVDTTAAGDTFIGALVTQLSQGKTVDQAVAYANRAAAWCVQGMGAQSSIPYKSDIE